MSNDQSLRNIVVSVVMHLYWKPDYLQSLYMDDEDEFGLIFWYKEIQEIEKEEEKRENQSSS